MGTKLNRHSIHISLRKEDPFEDQLAQAIKLLPHGWGKIVFTKLCRSILPYDQGVAAMRNALEMLCTGPVNFQPAQNLTLPPMPHQPHGVRQTVQSSQAPLEDVSRESTGQRELDGMMT